MRFRWRRGILCIPLVLELLFALTSLNRVVLVGSIAAIALCYAGLTWFAGLVGAVSLTAVGGYSWTPASLILAFLVLAYMFTPFPGFHVDWRAVFTIATILLVSVAALCGDISLLVNSFSVTVTDNTLALLYLALYMSPLMLLSYRLGLAGARPRIRLWLLPAPVATAIASILLCNTFYVHLLIVATILIASYVLKPENRV